jgi:small nuclear ribonucleoprotein (snRNP)-like protein
MATKKTTIAAEIQIKPGDSAKTIGDLRNELNEIPKAASKAAEGSIAQLKELKKQLKNTAAGSEEFKQLFNQIDDLEDKLKGSKKASADWIDTLASAGGPVGALGNALNTAKVSMTSFGSALKASGIGLLVAVVGGLAAAFSQNEEAMKKLQPIMTQFGRILNGILKALDPIINAFLNLATKALPYVTDAFGVAYSAISSFLQGIGKIGEAVGKLIKGDFVGAWDSAKSAVADFGKRYDEAQKGFIAGTKELTDKEKEELEKRKLAREAALAKRKADEEKAAAERLAAEKKENDELIKEYEAYLKRRELANKTAYVVTRADIKKAEEEKKTEDDKAEEDRINKNLTWQQKALASVKVTGAAIVEQDKANSDERIKQAEVERSVRVASLQAIADASQALGQILGEQTAAGKALGIASALINTYIGASEVIRAKSTLPEPFGTISKIANVAAIVATGIKSVRAITAVNVPGAASGGGGQNINSNIAAPLSPQASVTTLNQAQVNQIGNIASKAYVVESDVTGNQERIRRLNRAARIS